MIRRASSRDGGKIDVRIVERRIVEIGYTLASHGEAELPANGGLLVPGLHDHHVHVAATAAAMSSVRCGPPQVEDEAALIAALAVPGVGWMRGTGYHDSVAGAIDRRWLDRFGPHRPVRIQHRSGRLWIFNSAGLERLLASALPPPPGLERADGQWTGRLYDEDAWARAALGGSLPSFAGVGTAFSRFGVTGLTEMSPANNDEIAGHFAAERRAAALPQHVLIAGQMALGERGFDPVLHLGHVKIHLHEAHLPAFDDVVASIAAAHDRGRAVAIHCVTEVELVFSLSAFEDAGTRPGDRIEHAALAPDPLIDQIAALGLVVCVQPNFVAERGDAYRGEIDPAEWPHLYRLRAFQSAGISIAGGSDTPFGAADPWAAMAAAISRRTTSGASLGAAEALAPEAALNLFLADPQDFGRTRAIIVGAPADLCLLDAPWSVMRTSLSADRVRATLIDGRLVYERIDQPPA